MITIYYCRDQTYKKGVNLALIKEYERMGKPLDEFYNEKKLPYTYVGLQEESIIK
jgi:hypothetical protein